MRRTRARDVLRAGVAELDEINVAKEARSTRIVATVKP
jgi:hypothetical protein